MDDPANAPDGVQGLNSEPSPGALPGGWSPFDAEGTLAPALEAGFMMRGALRED